MTKKTKPLHEHIRVKRILDACRSGQILCCTHTTLLQGGAEVRYHLEPSQRQVATLSAEDAISTGLLIARNDGLFADTSQTWGIANG